MTSTAEARNSDAGRLRDVMTDKLIRRGGISSPQIERAFRTVPRHAFAIPGTPLEECYHGDVVRTKKDADGVTLSSISAAWLQARMITQAGIGPGARVLEIGTTGYNAALLAEVTGPQGHVVTLDLDPEITERAATVLQATGYSGRVTVLTGDGEHGAPGHGMFDAIVASDRAGNELGGALLGRICHRECPVLVVVGARGLVAAVGVLVEAPVPGAPLTVHTLGVCHGRPPHSP